MFFKLCLRRYVLGKLEAASWHSAQKQGVNKTTRIWQPKFAVNRPPNRTFGELIAIAEAQSPGTRATWELARERKDALGVGRSEHFPTLAAVALSQTRRLQSYPSTRCYRETLDSLAMFNMNYEILGFGRSGDVFARMQVLTARATLALETGYSVQRSTTRSAS